MSGTSTSRGSHETSRSLATGCLRSRPISGTRKRRGAFHLAVDEAVRASARCTHRVAFWPNMSEPCLVVADYCTWAIQRKWERNDARSQVLLADKISSETEIEVAGNK
jgi:hypothetical protein